MEYGTGGRTDGRRATGDGVRVPHGAVAARLGPVHLGGAEHESSRRPFHLIGDIYYVGSSDVTSFLIVTPAGDILLDGGFVETAPRIEANIRALGFKLSDVKILLNSHAHYDHAGGLAELKRATGARFVAMQGDAALLARGGRGDFFFGDRDTFPPVEPDRVIHDGDTVMLGGVTLTAHLTAGHTRGCTTWTMPTEVTARRCTSSSSAA